MLGLLPNTFKNILHTDFYFSWQWPLLSGFPRLNLKPQTNKLLFIALEVVTSQQANNRKYLLLRPGSAHHIYSDYRWDIHGGTDAIASCLPFSQQKFSRLASSKSAPRGLRASWSTLYIDFIISETQAGTTKRHWLATVHSDLHSAVQSGNWLQLTFNRNVFFPKGKINIFNSFNFSLTRFIPRTKLVKCDLSISFSSFKPSQLCLLPALESELFVRLDGFLSMRTGDVMVPSILWLFWCCYGSTTVSKHRSSGHKV